MSSSVMQQRLNELQEALLADRDEQGAYRLTALGRDAATELLGLARWAQRWAAVLDQARSSGPRNSGKASSR